VKRGVEGTGKGEGRKEAREGSPPIYIPGYAADGRTVRSELFSSSSTSSWFISGKSPYNIKKK